MCLDISLQNYSFSILREFPDVQARFRKGRGIRDQISNICWITRKSKGITEKTSAAASVTMLNPLTLWITVNSGKFLEMGISDHLTCLLKNLYSGQEATIRTGHGTMDGLKIGKEVHQDCISSPCLFNLYSDYNMQNARLVPHYGFDLHFSDNE